MKFIIACILNCGLVAASDLKKTEIRGIVSDEEASLIERALIELNCAGFKSKPASAAVTETNAKGEFELHHELSGACTVKVSSPGFHSVQVSLGPPNKRPMELGTTQLNFKNCSQSLGDCITGMKGRVMDVSGAPITNATIEFGCEDQDKRNIILRTPANTEGYFSTKRFMDRACSAKATAPGFMPLNININVPQRGVLDLGIVRLEVATVFNVLK